MAEFMTIYTKDYMWPPRKPVFPRGDLTCAAANISPPGLTDLAPGRHNADAILGKCPNTETPEDTDTDTCLKRLYEQNPNVLSVMRKLPPKDALKKFNLERLKSTYQVDFDHINDQPPVRRKACNCPLDEDETGPSSSHKPAPCKHCNCPAYEIEPPKAQCKVEPPSGRSEMIKRRKPAHKCERNPCRERVARYQNHKKKQEAKQEPAFLLKVLPPWTSEYRDAINKAGAEIMREMRMSARSRAKLKRRKILFERKECDDEALYL